MKKFRFTKETAKQLAENGKDWEGLLFKACIEGKDAGVKASLFAEALRATGFRCGTGPARAAFKAVRDGGNQKAMVAAVNTVKAKRKSTGTGTGKAGAGADTGTGTGAGADAGADTLAGALEAAAHAARNGNIAVVESWIAKAQAILATTKESTKKSIKRMGGVA